MGRKARTQGWNPQDSAALRERLVTLRERHGMSQKEAASQLDITLAYLKQLESGKAALTLTLIRRMAGLYEVFPGFLLAMLGVEEFDWLAALVPEAGPATTGAQLSNFPNEDRDELVSYVLYVRLKRRLASAT